MDLDKFSNSYLAANYRNWTVFIKMSYVVCVTRMVVMVLAQVKGWLTRFGWRDSGPLQLHDMSL